jgi:acetyl-CoA acyltransferase
MATTLLSRHANRAMLASSRAFSTSRSVCKASLGKNLVLIDGVRTPFLQASTLYKNLMPHDLQRAALVALVNKTGIDRSIVDYICCGTVIAVRRKIMDSLGASIEVHSFRR